MLTNLTTQVFSISIYAILLLEKQLLRNKKKSSRSISVTLNMKTAISLRCEVLYCIPQGQTNPTA